MTTTRSPHQLDTPPTWSSAIKYFIRRGTVTLSLVYIPIISVALLHGYLELAGSGWFGVVLYMYSLSFTAAIAFSLLISAAWGWCVDFFALGTAGRNEKTVLSMFWVMVVGFIATIVTVTDFIPAIYRVVMFASVPAVLGFWTWRYWTTLEPVEKKKRGEA